MLILTRKPNQAVMIGADVVVTILGVKGAHVKIGIIAPKSITVDREEIYLAKRAEKAAEAQA